MPEFPDKDQYEFGLQSKRFFGNYYDEEHGGVRILRVSDDPEDERDIREIAWHITTFGPNEPARLMRRKVGPWEEIPDPPTVDF